MAFTGRNNITFLRNYSFSMFLRRSATFNTSSVTFVPPLRLFCVRCYFSASLAIFNSRGLVFSTNFYGNQDKSRIIFQEKSHITSKFHLFYFDRHSNPINPLQFQLPFLFSIFTDLRFLFGSVSTSGMRLDEIMTVRVHISCNRISKLVN